MFGWWGGTRQVLAERGYRFDKGYVSELAADAFGVYEKDVRNGHTDRFSFCMAVDLNKVVGIISGDGQIIVTNRNGYDFKPLV